MDAFCCLENTSRELRWAARMFQELRFFSPFREELQAKSYVRVWLEDQAWALGALAEPCLEVMAASVPSQSVLVVILDVPSEAVFAWVPRDPRDSTLYEAVEVLLARHSTPENPAVRISQARAWACPVPDWATEHRESAWGPEG